eukprot:9244274-Pyramimonas_sp.AAC.1
MASLAFVLRTVRSRAIDGEDAHTRCAHCRGRCRHWSVAGAGRGLPLLLVPGAPRGRVDRVQHDPGGPPGRPRLLRILRYQVRVRPE